MTLLSEILNLWRSRQLGWVLTRRELAARNAGTAAGWLWAYVQPLLTVAAYYLVFDVVFAMRLGSHAPTSRVGAFLIVGALPWMAYCDATMRGMNSLMDAGSVLQKNPLPPILFPVRAVLATMLVHGPLLLLLIVGYWRVDHNAWVFLALLPLWLLQTLFTALSAYLLAVLAAAVRDTVQVMSFVLSVGIFLSPVLFPVSQFPAAWQWVLWLNPMTAWVQGYQAIYLSGQWPTADCWWAMLIWIGLVSVVLNLVLSRCRDQLVDWL